jgi:glycosyltransferase involved in cell wall biosynthesis
LGNKTSKLWKLLDKKLTWIVLKELNRLKYGNLFKQAIKTSDRFVLLSENFIEELHFFGLKKHKPKTIAIPNPASFETQEKSNIAKKENRIIYVGRLTHTQKRVDRLMEIWKQIHESYPNWKFDVVGDGSQKKTMQDFCDKHNLVRIYFHGNQDPRPFLERAKIFTMTSDFEGFPMVLIEAQSYGVVPVAFNCFSSINDIILNSKTGLLINNFDNDDYINNIDKLITDPNYLRQLSINGIDHSKSFKKNKIASKWITHFNSL